MSGRHKFEPWVKAYLRNFAGTLSTDVRIVAELAADAAGFPFQHALVPLDGDSYPWCSVSLQVMDKGTAALSERRPW